MVTLIHRENTMYYINIIDFTLLRFNSKIPIATNQSFSSFSLIILLTQILNLSELRLPLNLQTAI
jgi:hypothetical protein